MKPRNIQTIHNKHHASFAIPEFQTLQKVMAEPTVADLKPIPSTYKSSRGLFDVLVGEDTALPLIEASSDGSVEKLQVMLAESQWREIMLQSPHCIYHEDRPTEGENDIRGVLAMPILNLQRAILKAAESGHAAAVSVLLEFASQQGITPASVIDRTIIKTTIQNGHAAVLESLANALPTAATIDLGHETQPLELAIGKRDVEVVKVLLKLGAGRVTTRKTSGSFQSSWLSRAAPDPTITKLLLENGQTVARSGALHMAALRGALESMRLLIDHGADVDERLPEDGLPRSRRSLYASWTPMHFAAYGGQRDAVNLLENEGARTDVEDENGKTPFQLLAERQ